MSSTVTLNVNGITHRIESDPDTPLLYVLRNELGLHSPKYGCGSEQCGACKVLVDGSDVPSCKLPIKQLENTSIVTMEGLSEGDDLHPLQETFLEDQAAQCGYCTAGMLIAAQGLLNRIRYPNDQQIRDGLHNNLCRCGTYDRVRRAIRLRIGRPVQSPIYQVVDVQSPNIESATDDLPQSVLRTPDLDAWIRINPNETITVYTGKAEIGQGIKTAIAMIAAEELDVGLGRMRVVSADTDQTPNEGITAGSMSVQVSGTAVRVAAAEARYVLLSLAYEHLEAESPSDQLEVHDGTITDPATGRQTSYWALMGGKPFGHQITVVRPTKSPDTYQIVGQPAQRLDLPGKASGESCYVHDLTLPNMAHGRVVRPPNYHARLVSVDSGDVLNMPGVIKVIQDGSFLAVLAEEEIQAIRARDVLTNMATWESEQTLNDQRQQYDDLLNGATRSKLVEAGVAGDKPVPPVQIPDEATQTLNATYYRPFQMHGALGPSAAMALLEDDALTLWSHTQGVFNLQIAVAEVLDMPAESVRVVHTEGAGCYGHNGADDVGLDAALLARALPGRPVLVKWMREDEHRWEPYSSAMVIKMQASLDSARTVCDWNHDVWSYAHSTRPRDGAGLLASWHLETPLNPPEPQAMGGAHSGSHRNAAPKYAFKKQRIVKHFAPNSPVRVSAMRSLGAYANVFAIESFMDELAYAAGDDPVAFRLSHLEDERSIAVVKATAEKADWQPHTKPALNGTGRGFAFAQYKNQACYAAMVVDVEVDRKTGIVHLKRCVIGADTGQVVNPDGLSNQLEGGFVQAASWTLYEQVNYDTNGITSIDWDTYPILRSSNAPMIQTVLLNRPNAPFIGSGEGTQGPTPAAIANAIYDAVGIRLREIPFTPERIKAALDELEN